MKVCQRRIEHFREVLGITRPAENHPPLVQVESNIEEWPVFQLGRSKSNSVVIERTIEGEDGSSLKQRVEVSAPGKYRLPGRFDYDVYSAVLELLEIRGGMPESGNLGFSLHELILIMGLEPSGRTYEDLKRSLRRIAATVLESDNAFWSEGGRRHISDTFRLWDVAFDAITDKNGSGTRHQIEFGKLFKRSFAEQYLRGLDIDFFWELDSPVAKRLYRLVDLKRAGRHSWGEDLFELQKYIPIGPYAYVSKIKEKLSAAHEELVERGFLSGVAYEGKSRVVYELSNAFRTRREALELAGTKEETIAIQLLTRSELRGDIARDLVAKYGPAHCTRYANALPRQKNVRNPAGWLRKAIEESFDLPKSPREDRATRSNEARVLTISSLDAVLDAETDVHRPPSTLAAEALSTDGEQAALAPCVKPEPSRCQLPPEPHPNAQELWDAVLADLVERSDVPSLRVWFTGTVATSLKDDTLTLTVPNGLAEEHIGGRFKEGIERLLKERLSDRARLRLEVSSPAGSL